MQYNSVVDIKVVTDATSLPCTVDEAKAYMRLTQFTDDDTLIESMIKAARQKIEQVAQITLNTKSLKAVVNNPCGYIEIPFGPVQTITAVTDSDGNAVADYETAGNDFLLLISPTYENLTIEYDAGYETLPDILKLDVFRLVSYLYLNRGDSSSDPFTFDLTKSYSRAKWLI